VALRVAVPGLFLVLLVRGCADGARETRALELGSGLRATASVEAREQGGVWQRCDYSGLTGTFGCPGLVTACDATANLVNDAAPSWGFVTPAITASPETSDVEIRIRLNARLAGRYDVAVSDGSVELSVDGEPARAISRRRLDYDGRGERAIELVAKLPMTAWSLTFVRDDTVVPDRPFLEAPPPDAPAEVRAIGADQPRRSSPP
jgi:hypothetical protein